MLLERSLSMLITERRLRRLIRSVLVESESIDIADQQKRMMSLFANPKVICVVLNKACKSTKIKSNVHPIKEDDDIVANAMNDEALNRVYKENMGIKYTLDPNNKSKIEGVLRSILSICSDEDKLNSEIKVEDVESVTNKFTSYAEIGATRALDRV
jgi:hypothetical protein